MPRQPRFNVPGIPQHVIQRGNNRQATFFGEDDYQRYLDWLKGAADKIRCEIHAYVLMSNHVHLLVTPGTPDALPRLMQSLGQRYVRFINATHQRTGTLWEGCYKAGLVDSERYLLSLYRYIELNPVRANMVPDPADYRWSSYRCHALGEPNDIVVDHPLYNALGASPEERRLAYRELFRSYIDDRLLGVIRASVNQCGVLGSERFKDEIGAVVSRRVRPAPRGRPRTHERSGAVSGRR